MKQKLTVYQKPTCTKCRIALRLLRERGAEFEVSSGRGTVVWSFSNSIQDVYTRGMVHSSGENGGTCRRVCALLSVWADGQSQMCSVESKPEWPRADYFKVHGEDGRDYLVKHDLESNEWWLGKSW